MLNEDIKPADLIDTTFNAEFVSNNISFHSITNAASPIRPVLYDEIPIYTGKPFPVWVDQAYRTIVFSEPPTGELLTWLQANGVKQ